MSVYPTRLPCWNTSPLSVGSANSRPFPDRRENGIAVRVVQNIVQGRILGPEVSQGGLGIVGQVSGRFPVLVSGAVATAEKQKRRCTRGGT